MNINIVISPLPSGVNALTTINDDGTYTILLNELLSREEGIKSILHEVSHIQGDDFNRDDHANLLEHMRHSESDNSDLDEINFFYHYI